MKTYPAFLAIVFVFYVTETSAWWWEERYDAFYWIPFPSLIVCERECWRYRMCTSYYLRTTSSEHMGCVLIAGNWTVPGASVPAGWEERKPAWNTSLYGDNGCGSRPCNNGQICLIQSGWNYSCGPRYPVCNATVRNDGVYRDSSLLTAEKTTFTCNPPLVWTPPSASNEVTCLREGVYSSLNGECKNITYYTPNVPFNGPLPEAINAGWGACIKGNFTYSGYQPTRMDLNFHDRDVSCALNKAVGGDIYLQLQFREHLCPREADHKVSAYAATPRCNWTAYPGKDIGELPLNANAYFEMTLRMLLNYTLQIFVKDRGSLLLDLNTERLSLKNATHLEITNDVKLTFVDLSRGC